MNPVLIVDDEPAVGDFISQKVLRLVPGAQFLRAKDVPTARILVQQNPTCLIILDWNLLPAESYLPKDQPRVSDEFAQELVNMERKYYRYTSIPAAIPENFHGLRAYRKHGDLDHLIKAIVVFLTGDG